MSKTFLHVCFHKLCSQGSREMNKEPIDVPTFFCPKRMNCSKSTIRYLYFSKNCLLEFWKLLQKRLKVCGLLTSPSTFPPNL